MPNPQKESKVREIAEQLSSAEAAVLAGYRGLTVHEAAELRAALAEVDARFAVVKNSLTRLAVKEAGLEGLDELIDGPTAIAYVRGDAVTAAKRLVEQGRRFPVLEIRGGFAEGRILTAGDIRRFADLEPREVMLAKLAGLAKGQLGRTAWMLQALQSKFVLLMEALQEKVPGAAEDTPDPDRAGGGGQEPAQPQPEEAGEPAQPGEGEPEPTQPGPEKTVETQQEGGA
ncbi:MAG TPA: 50S ribosomal protein L10 [Actinomycetota bacterium]|jgi:large subunit ribosomal protein L10|nr:50S ribosomal protein L10 [Actinomycetota bacterium]